MAPVANRAKTIAKSSITQPPIVRFRANLRMSPSFPGDRTTPNSGSYRNLIGARRIYFRFQIHCILSELGHLIVRARANSTCVSSHTTDVCVIH